MYLEARQAELSSTNVTHQNLRLFYLCAIFSFVLVSPKIVNGRIFSVEQFTIFEVPFVGVGHECSLAVCTMNHRFFFETCWGSCVECFYLLKGPLLFDVKHVDLLFRECRDFPPLFSRFIPLLTLELRQTLRVMDLQRCQAKLPTAHTTHQRPWLLYCFFLEWTIFLDVVKGAFLRTGFLVNFDALLVECPPTVPAGWKYLVLVSMEGLLVIPTLLATYWARCWKLPLRISASNGGSYGTE